MTLHYRLPEKALEAAFADSLGMHEDPEAPFARMASAMRDDPQSHQPHPIYGIDFTDLCAEKGFEAATLTGWRFLSPPEGEQEFALELFDDDAASAPEFAQINSGPFVSATRDALRLLEEDSKLAEGDFEIRLLKLPEIHVMALWLVGGQNGEDVIVPLAPAPRPIEEKGQKLWTTKEFEAVIFSLAKRRAEFEV